MEVINLFSGSKGNATLVKLNDFNFLIDCGKNTKQINLSLGELGLSLDDIKYIFITHSHFDHISSVKVIQKQYPKIKFVLHKEMLESHNDKDVESIFDDDKCIFIEEKPFRGRSLDIIPFKLHHDVFCFGYLFQEHQSQQALVFISDNGKLWDKDTISLISNKNFYMIESNHDRGLQILDKKRNSLLKRRVLSNFGHTNNYDAMDLAIKVVGENTSSVCFHHLSEECNSSGLAYNIHMNLLEIRGFKTKFKNVKIQYADQDKATIL